MAYTDWIPTMDSIKNKKNLSIIEFGLGDGTEFLINNFKNVHSFELADTKTWFDEANVKYANSKNWTCEFAHFDNYGFYDYMLNLPQALLDKLVDLFSQSKYDIVFMDGGYHNRGQIANFILNQFSPKAMIIHDINYAFQQDMYDQIIVPEDYSFVDDTNGEGTRIYYKQGVL
jgi:hypothetical protein